MGRCANSKQIKTAKTLESFNETYSACNFEATSAGLEFRRYCGRTTILLLTATPEILLQTEKLKTKECPIL